ncbi:MAG TPA: hypothetical protein VM487_19855 [Phycisphaerae bacterium]|nr:hypothetical protein [Phycisphaerae bacterium]
MPETLNGLIERVTYHNPENGFAVLKVKVKGRQDLVTVVGSTTSVTAGEHLEAIGRWVVDREHGQQFKAEELKTTHPASAEGIERYLASGAIRSIGPKLAAKIVKIYKDRTVEGLEGYGVTVICGDSRRTLQSQLPPTEVPLGCRRCRVWECSPNEPVTS